MADFLDLKIEYFYDNMAKVVIKYENIVPHGMISYVMNVIRYILYGQSTLSRELKRNSTPSGKYFWCKAHAKAMERRKRSVHNAALAPE